MNYINFAIEEQKLFRFLFQSNEFLEMAMIDLLNLEEVMQVIATLKQEVDVSMEEAKEIFSILFIFVHGYASLYANNAMVYEKESIISALESVFEGAVYSVKC